MSVKSKTGETAWVLEFWSSGGYDEPLVRAGLIISACGCREVVGCCGLSRGVAAQLCLEVQ